MNVETGNDQVSRLRIIRLLKLFRLFRLARLLKILRLKQLITKFYANLSFSREIIVVFDLLRLWFFLIILAHWLACGFSFAADISTNGFEDT